MSNLKKFALVPTAIHHLRDGNDELMYADGPDGKPDESKPMRAHMFGPGSKRYAAARAAQSNRSMDRFKAKGKDKTTAAEQAEDTAKFLIACTDHLENVEVDQLTGEALLMNVYTDLEVCFIASQLDKFIGETANFTQKSPPP